MALAEPKPKKNCKTKYSQPLPIFENQRGERHRFKGKFNGLCVQIDDFEDMQKIVTMGYFGKATLSRNEPELQKMSPNIIRDRVLRNRKRVIGDSKGKHEKIVVLPDSDSDTDDSIYFTNLKPHYQLVSLEIKEVVSLSLEEAFFLCEAIKCLDIVHNNKILDLREAWLLFQENDKRFAINYIVYYYFRAKNWVVKNGIKFGGDYLLYKQGPPFFHASYVVIISVVDEDLKKIESFSRRSMKYINLMGLNRLCETAGKELLICEVIWPKSLSQSTFDFIDLQKFTIKETIMKRWLPSKEDEVNSEYD